MITLVRVEMTLTELRRELAPEAEAERTRTTITHTPAISESGLVRSGDVGRLSRKDRAQEPTTSTDNAWREKRVVLVSPANHTSACERWEDHSARSREAEQSSARRDCGPSRQKLQRRDFPNNIQEWSHTRHGGTHDHAEKNAEPEQPSSGDAPSTGAVRGGWDSGAGDSETMQNTWVSTWTGEGFLDVAQGLDETQAPHCEDGVSSVLAE